MLAVALLLGLAAGREGRTAPPPNATLAERLREAFELHGFLLGTVSGRTTGLRPRNAEGGDFVLGEERVRMELSGRTPSGDAGFLARGDVVYDNLAGEVAADLREAYGSFASGPLDVRLGRQIATWGIGDLFFIADVFPKDWDSFFSGRPIEYLKLGLDGASARYSSDWLGVEALAIPHFTPDELPPAERFFFFDPFSRVPVRHETEPATRVSNTELALRLYRRVESFDLALYAYRGFWRAPGARVDDPSAPTRVTLFFPKLSVAAASAQRTVLDGVLGLEGGYYDSREDRRGEDPTIPNSEWRFLTMYQRQPWEDFTVGVQFFGAVMEDYSAYRAALPPGNPRADRFRGIASLRLTQLLDYQTWTLGLFAAYSPTDDDYFLQPVLAYRATDRLGVSLGANVFGGRSRTTPFAQFERSDNVFSNVRLDF